MNTEAQTTEAAEPKPRNRRRIVSRVLAASAITPGVAAGGGYLWLDQTSDVHNLGTTACTTVTPSGTAPSPQSVQEICALLDELTGAWPRRRRRLRCPVHRGCHLHQLRRHLLPGPHRYRRRPPRLVQRLQEGHQARRLHTEHPLLRHRYRRRHQSWRHLRGRTRAASRSVENADLHHRRPRRSLVDRRIPEHAAQERHGADLVSLRSGDAACRRALSGWNHAARLEPRCSERPPTRVDTALRWSMRRHIGHREIVSRCPMSVCLLIAGDADSM